MGRKLITGLCVVLVGALAGCGSSSSGGVPSRADSAPAETTTPGSASTASVAPVELDSMVGLVLTGDRAVLADSMVPTGFWTGSADGDGNLDTLANPKHPLWVQAVTVDGAEVLAIGARCDEMKSREPEVMCSPGTAELWRLDLPDPAWHHVADLGDATITGARFVAITPDTISVTVNTLPNPRAMQIRLYDVARSTGRVTPVTLPTAMGAPATDADAVVCGGTGGSRLALLAGDGAAPAAWLRDGTEDTWTEVAPPSGTPDGGTATIGCAGSSGFATFGAGGSNAGSLLLAPGDSAWRSAEPPPWTGKALGDGPLLGVGNSDGNSFWAAGTLYSLDPSTAEWTSTAYDAPADVGAVALDGAHRVVVATASTGSAPTLSVVEPASAD